MERNIHIQSGPSSILRHISEDTQTFDKEAGVVGHSQRGLGAACQGNGVQDNCSIVKMILDKGSRSFCRIDIFRILRSFIEVRRQSGGDVRDSK